MAGTDLIILGNGFDVHCGLKSNYDDFFRGEILNTNAEKLQDGVSGFWEELLFDYYVEYHESKKNWCAIEDIIYKTLCDIIGNKNTKGLGKVALRLVEDKRNGKSNSDMTFKRIDQCIVLVCRSFFQYKTSSSYYDENGNLYSEHDLLKSLLEYFLQELNKLEQRFCKYLKNQIIDPITKTKNSEYIINFLNLLTEMTHFSSKHFEKIDDLYITENEICTKEVIDLVKSTHNLPSKLPTRPKTRLISDFDNLKNTYILSFNYTNLFDILKIDEKCPYNNVHGKLCMDDCKEDCNHSTLIFGIDDTEIQSNTEYSNLRIFSKTYRKMKGTSLPCNILPPNNGQGITIKFYGHSLAKADYSYFQSIFDYYNLYGNTNVSLEFYYSPPYEQTDSIYQLISEYGKTLTNKDQGKNLIHKLLLENRLSIKPVND